MKDLPVRIYTKESPVRKPVRLFKAIIRDVWDGRELAWRLSVRDISAQYRQTFIGVLWAFVLPLINTITWIFLNKSGLIKMGATNLPYPLYVFTGTMLWGIFIDALNAPLKQTSGAKGMLAKINFPREALVISGIYQTLFNGGIKISLLFIALFVMRVYPDWHLVFFPFGVFSLILAGTVIGLFITPIGLLYKDIGNSIPLIMQFFMYVTPVVLPMPQSGWAVTIFTLNPMTPLILTARDWLTGFSPEFLVYYLLVNLASIVCLVLLAVVFRIALPILIERM